MFREKTFSLAFLISLSWHLFCMFFVTIVVLPASFPMAKTSTVSFLGPILEKTAFEIMIEKGTRTKHTIYGRPMYSDKKVLARSEKGMPLRFKDLLPTANMEEVKTSSKDLFGDSKPAPPPYQFGANLKQEKVEQGNLFMEGPLADREILFKPEEPVASKRIDQRAESFIVELKIGVRSGGNVDEVTLLASSGYPDIDLAAIRYIKAFRFSPLTSAAKDTLEWGKIKISLKSR